jgi:hypothetical protein
MVVFGHMRSVGFVDLDTTSKRAGADEPSRAVCDNPPP